MENVALEDARSRLHRYADRWLVIARATDDPVLRSACLDQASVLVTLAEQISHEEELLAVCLRTGSAPR